MRVAMLSYRGKPHVGGQGVYVSRLSTALTDLGHNVVVLGGPPYPELDERVLLVRLGGLDMWAAPHPMRKPRAWELKDWIDLAEYVSFVTGNFSEPMAFSLRAWRHLRTRRADFDLVHDNQTLGWGILALHRQGWPLLETIHHPITVDRRLELAHARTLPEQIGKRRWYAFTKMQTQVAQRLPRVLTVSESSKRDIVGDHGVLPERIHVVPVGVDPEMFKPLPEIVRVPGRLITTASADVTMKGLSFLLEAVAKLRTERHIELTIIGKAKADSAASRAIMELGLADAVTFVSGVSDRRIVELYAEAELAVVPSLYEGFSLPAIEAMSCGVPLVATTGGALPEVAGKHGETCFLTEPGDAGALAAVLQEALDNPSARDRVGRAGRRRVVNQWSWRHTAERTVEQYRAAINEAARSQATRSQAARSRFTRSQAARSRFTRSRAPRSRAAPFETPVLPTAGGAVATGVGAAGR